MKKLLDYDGLVYFYKKLKQAWVTVQDFLLYQQAVENKFQAKCFFVIKLELSASQAIDLSDNGAISETTYRIKNTSESEITVTLNAPEGFTLEDMVGMSEIAIPAGKYCEIVVTQWDDNIMTYNLGVQE